MAAWALTGLSYDTKPGTNNKLVRFKTKDITNGLAYQKNALYIYNHNVTRMNKALRNGKENPRK